MDTHPLARTCRRIRIANLGCVRAAVLALASAGSLAPFAHGADAASADVPSTAETADTVVKLEDFKVTASIGSYIEDTSSMAAKVPTPMKEIAGSMEILNQNAISDHRALSLDDLYPYVIGLTRASSSATGWAIRGFSVAGGTGTPNNEFDGLQGTTVAANGGSISTANVERLEVLKGPNSVLYGSMEPAGVLNVVTKSPKANQEATLFGATSTFAGTFSPFGRAMSFFGHVDTTGPIDKDKHWLYRLIVEADDLKPFRTGDYAKNLFVYPSLMYRWSPMTWLSVKAEAATEKRRGDDGLWFPFGSVSLVAPYNTVYQELTDVDRDYGEALSTAFQTQFAGDWVFRAATRSTWHVDSRNIFANSNSKVVNKQPPSTSTIQRSYLHRHFGHRYNYFDVNTYGTVGPERLRNTLLFGAGGGDELTDLARFGNGPLAAPVTLVDPLLGVTPYPADGTGAQDPKSWQDSVGAYASDQLKLGQALHLSGAVRHDQSNSHTYDPYSKIYANQFVAATIFQAGIVYDVTDDLSAYANWGQSFRPQPLTNVDSTGRTVFDPQKGKLYEAGLKHSTADHRIQTTLAAFYITKTNVLVNSGVFSTTTGQLISRLDGEQRSEGLEYETEWQPFPNWQVQTGLTFMKAQITQSTNSPAAVGKDLANAPRASGNVWTRYNIPSGPLLGLGFGFGASYIGKRWGGDPTTAAYFVMPGSTRVDTAVYYQWRRCDFTLNVQNALDRKYIASANNATVVSPGDPRKLTLSVGTRF